MAKKKLKLFVWTEFKPDYTSGLAFAIAEDVNKAQELIGVPDDDWGPVKEYPIDSPIACYVYGGS